VTRPHFLPPRLFTLALLLLAAGATAAPAAEKERKPDAADEFFDRGPIPRIKIELSPEAVNKLRQDARRDVPATLRETGAAGADVPEVVYENVAVHLKGGAGSFQGLDDKPGLTLNLGKSAPDKSTPARTFHGLTKFHLNNSVQDPSYMSENLGNALFREAGVPAARVTYARVSINDRDLGLFALKEGFDDVFLKRFFPGPRGTLYEGYFLRDIDTELPGRVNKSRRDEERLKALIDAAREADPAERRRKLERVLDVDRFLTFMAMEAMTAHWDGYCPQRNNYRVYHDTTIDRLVFLPHGTDQLFQQPGYPLMHGNALVAQAVTANAEDKARYLERVAQLRKTLFTPERLERRLKEISARLAPAMEKMGEGAAREHKERTEDFRRRIAERIRSIDEQLASQPRPLKFDADGVAVLAAAKWQPQRADGGVTLDEAEESGRPLLHIRVEPGGGGTASYRTTVLLTRGRYVFEGPCHTRGVSGSAGPNAGAGLRISGAQRKPGLAGDADWQTNRFEFEVTEESKDVVLVCELSAAAGETWFAPQDLKLRRR
jgi:spore coat protein H